LHFPQEDRPTGQFIYEKFLDNQNKPKLSRREQALIYIQDFFSRKEDIIKVLKKNPVVSDRFYTSTMAYQTAGLSASARQEFLQWIEYLINDLPRPDRVIFLDTLPEISLHHLRDQHKNYHEELPKLRAFRASYLKLAHEQKWTIINSMEGKNQRSIADIHAEVWQDVKNILEPRS
jgi:thymidylate kinase